MEQENEVIEKEEETVEAPVEEPTFSASNIVDNIILGDNVKAKTEFNTMMHQRTQASIDSYKQDFAKQLFSDIPEAQPQEADAVVEESFDVINDLQSANINRNAELRLYDGSVIPVDNQTADVLIKYISTLDEENKNYFIEDISQNERGLLKGIEIAFHSLGETDANV